MSEKGEKSFRVFYFQFINEVHFLFWIFILFLILFLTEILWFHETDNGFDVVVLIAHDIDGSSWIFFPDSGVTRCPQIYSFFSGAPVFLPRHFCPFCFLSFSSSSYRKLTTGPFHSALTQAETVEKLREGKMWLTEGKMAEGGKEQKQEIFSCGPGILFILKHLCLSWNGTEFPKPTQTRHKHRTTSWWIMIVASQL